ncbi:sulfurtransferase TusA family protein, partial [Enhygromyxa salina]|uniref:sulfurtransferase TusA family protein n=1 Tax=Enhygromyxa salina TaxID=215803 RepID=UPI0011B1E1E8
MSSEAPAQPPSAAAAPAPPEVTLDLRGVQCPGPVIALAKAATAHPAGTVVHMLADDPAFPMDLRSWLSSGQAELVELDDTTSEIHARVRIAAKLPRPPAAEAAQVDPQPPAHAAS